MPDPRLRREHPLLPLPARVARWWENPVVITRASFVADLLSAVPEVDGMVREHLDNYEGELLLHLLMADLVRYGVAAFEDSRSGEARRLLEFVDSCLSDGDEYVANAVLVSFIENYGYGQNEPDSFLAVWPDGLRAELGR